MTNKTTYGFSTFSKEGNIEDVKVGTKVWFNDQFNTDVGIVAEQDYKSGCGKKLK